MQTDRLRVASPARSHLPVALALILVGLIVYASLEPFAGWGWPAEGSVWFPLNPYAWQRWRSFDILLNFAIYVPFGFALRLRVASRSALLMSLLLALAVESAQMFLPTREPSALDVLANFGGGALGVFLGGLWRRLPGLAGRLRALRERLFISGPRGDLGLLLLLVWLAAHLNPAQSLFTASYLDLRIHEAEPAWRFLLGVQSALNVLGVGLFADLLMRSRRAGGLMLLAIVLTALCTKALVANAFLRPAAWEIWFNPSLALGVAIGSLLLAAAFALSRRGKNLICNVALLVAFGAAFIAPDLVLARPPLKLIDWSYGHLLTLTGLSHSLLLVWPLFVSAYLFSGAAGADRPESARIGP